MTISEYLKNPYGKGSSFAPSKKQIEDLEIELGKIKDRIVCKIYKYRDYVIYHVVVPSTKRDEVSYDVVVEVQLQNLHEGAATTEDIDFRVFSNCPSFIFTYAHIFKANKMLCDWLLPKYNKEVRTKSPDQRNRYGVMGLERSIYLAFRYLHITNRTNIAVSQTAAIKLSSRNTIINSVRSQEQIMAKVKEKIKKDPNEKATTEVGKDDPKFGDKGVNKSTKSNQVKKVKKTLFTRSIKDIKNGKSTTRVKKTKKTKSF